MFFDIGGWWLTCDHMFRRFGTPFACDWVAKEINGYVYTAAVPADAQIKAEATEYQSRYAPRVPRDPDHAGKIGAYLGWVLPHYAGNFLDWWRDRLRPEIERNFEYLDGFDTDGGGLHRARRAARGRHRHPRSPLEDPLDAQLRPVRLHAGPQRPARGGEGRRGRGPDGPPPELDRRSQLGLDRGPLEDEGGDQGRLRAARGLRGRDRRRRDRRPGGLREREALPRRARRAPPEGLRLQVDLVARVRLQDLARGPGPDDRGDPRLPGHRLRLPRRHRRGARRPRGGQARGAGGRGGRTSSRTRSSAR